MNEAINKLDYLLANAFSGSDDFIKHIKEDKKRWTYYRLQSKYQRSILSGLKCNSIEQYEDAIVHFKEASEEVKKLNEIVKDYRDVLEPEYILVEEVNYYGMLANQSIVLVNIFEKSLREDRLKNSTVFNFIELLNKSWDAFNYSKKAYNVNPMWTQYEDIMIQQYNYILNTLKNNKSLWKDVLLNFSKDTEFINLMKDIDNKKVRKISKEFDLKESKSFKMWISGSFFLLLFIVIFILISVISMKLDSTLKLILVLTFTEIILLIIGAFVLRTNNDLSEKNFLKLIRLALVQQFNFISKFKKRK